MKIEVKNFGMMDYCCSYQKMLYHNQRFDRSFKNEIWCLQHLPVFTQGRHGKKKHQYNLHNIPFIISDRGGQITYHGPGQAIIYFMLDLKRSNISIKALVNWIEQTCINQLKKYDIKGYTLRNTPGVYVDYKKIASLGLRVKNSKTYHGIAINTNMDLTPFKYIHPCGYKDIAMTQISEFVPEITVDQVFDDYTKHFIFKYFFNTYNIRKV